MVHPTPDRQTAETIQALRSEEPLTVTPPFRATHAGLNKLREKVANNVILRRQQAQKNLHLP
jgi:hypothetical protein